MHCLVWFLRRIRDKTRVPIASVPGTAPGTGPRQRPRTQVVDPLPEKEYKDWVKRRDPVKRIEKTIRSENAVAPKRMKEITASVESEFESAIALGKGGDSPRYVGRAAHPW